MTVGGHLPELLTLLRASSSTTCICANNMLTHHLHTHSLSVAIFLLSTFTHPVTYQTYQL